MPISDQINNITFFPGRWRVVGGRLQVGGGLMGVKPTDFFGLSAEMFVQL